jgi:hypothetical protein
MEQFITWYCSEPRLALNGRLSSAFAFTWNLSAWQLELSISALRQSGD